MTPSALAFRLTARALVIGAAFAASAALAQPDSARMPSNALPPVAPGTTPADIAAAPGLPGPQSVDPAPGAAGPYADHSERAFYTVNDRISRYEQRAASMLTGAQKRNALSEISSIKKEEKEQIARHGDLLDWARENLNHRLDVLKQAYPVLAG